MIVFVTCMIMFAAQQTRVAASTSAVVQDTGGVQGTNDGDDDDDGDFEDMGPGGRDFFPRGIVVDDDNRCRTLKGRRQFTSIQAAVDAARVGETIQVCPGTYREQVRVNKSVSIVGVRFENQNLVLIQPTVATPNTTNANGNGNPIAAIILVDGVRNVNLENLTVDGSGGSGGSRLIGVFYRNASGKVEHVAVRNINPNLNNASLGILAQSGTQGGQDNASRLEVLNSSVHDYDRGGIIGNGTGTVLVARGNRVSGSGERSATLQNGIQIGFGATGSIEDNFVFNNFFGGCNSIETCAQTGGASNILAFGGSGDAPQRGIRVTGNTVSRSQNNIALGGGLTDGSLLTVVNARVERNNVSDTDIFDAIAVVGNNNRVTRNRIFNSRRNAIFVLGNDNRVAGNIIDEAFVGIFEDEPSNNNEIRSNRFFNTRTEVVSVESTDNSSQDSVMHTRQSARRECASARLSK
jgi:hypothetical protein